MALSVEIFEGGEYKFSGRSFKITEDKNKALAPLGKQVYNFGWKFVLIPTEEQAAYFRRAFGCTRVVRNDYLSKRIDLYQTRKETLSVADYKKEYLPKLKDEKPYLREPDKFALESAIENVDEAYTNFFAKRAGFPKFVSKYNPGGNRYTTKQTNGNIGIEHTADGVFLKLPKVGKVRLVLPAGMTMSDIRRPGLHILKCTVSKDGQRYCASIGFEMVIDKIVPVADIDVHDITGIDLGLKDFCHIGTMDYKMPVSNPRWIKLHAKRLRRFQRSLSRRKYDRATHTGSRNYYRMLEKVRREHRKTRNQRMDFHHKLSRAIADSCRVFVCEDLNIRGMMKNHHLAKSVASVGWGQFLAFVKYKMERTGGRFLKVGRWFASSQLCHVCGFRNPLVRNLSVREWTCPECGTHHERDDNAVDNMILEGIRILEQEGCRIHDSRKPMKNQAQAA